MNNKINHSIPEEVIAQATSKLNEVAEILKPYLIVLTPTQRIELPKMSDGSLPFVQKCLGYCQSNPEFAPIYIDFKGLHNDLKTFEQLIPICHIVRQLENNLNDTILQAGAGSLVCSLSYYNSVKYATKMGAPGAKAIAEELSTRFARSNKTVQAQENN
jgi:hypothetical protein